MHRQRRIDRAATRNPSAEDPMTYPTRRAAESAFERLLDMMRGEK
jgi:hypothetical protein